MLATQDIYPFFTQIIVDWDTYLILIEKGSLRKTPLSNREKQVWEVVDKSLPIVLESRLTRLKLSEPEIWFVRIIVHKVKDKCIDIRQFEKKTNGDTNWYEPTDNGIVIPVNTISNLLDGIFKMFRKHKG